MMHPDYEIVLKDGSTVPILFNTWAFRQYSTQKGVELEELMTGVGSGASFKLSNIPDLLKWAALSYCRFNKTAPTFDADLDPDLWLDDIGYRFDSPQLIGLFKAFAVKLLNLDPAQFELAFNKAVGAEEKPQAEEKKSELIAA